jgi:hypothetical protein
LIATSVRVLARSFFHNMANMHFYSAYAHVQFVGDDLVRLALMDRADNGEFAVGDGARGRGRDGEPLDGMAKRRRSAGTYVPPAKTRRTASTAISNPSVIGI